MITYFCRLWPNKTKSGELVEAYYRSFRSYRDEQILTAGDQCMQEMEYFPKPVDVISRINQGYLVTTPYIIEEGQICCKCKVKSRCIREPADTGEWECRQCYSGLTLEQHRKKVQLIIEQMGRMENENQRQDPTIRGKN